MNPEKSLSRLVQFMVIKDTITDCHVKLHCMEIQDMHLLNAILFGVARLHFDMRMTILSSVSSGKMMTYV